MPLSPFSSPIYVTRPILPDLKLMNEQLADIWQSRVLTNYGSKHKLFEVKVKDFLGVENLSLSVNGAVALLMALKAMELPVGSEVITTPFTFPATPHAIHWNNLKIVFCDIDPVTMCIDANKIEELITPNTSAILGVHVYGIPCDVKKIDEIAKKHNLKVIYDAAHAFNTKIDGVPIGHYGDVSMHSFHATKLFNTVEGGCLVYPDESLGLKLYRLENFGIVNEEIVADFGINGKMNELQSAMGILTIDMVKEETEKRKKIFDTYNRILSQFEGIEVMKLPENATNSYQYYVIRIHRDKCKISRNELYEKLKGFNIMARKYFYPLCTEYYCYKHIKTGPLPVANKIKNEVLCLPYYGDLGVENAEKIAEIILSLVK
jgi:dTDP-4-amino-4,6-dideoxygalactose transaminase